MRKILLIFTTCFALLGSAYAQQEVTGTVVDNDGAGIPGVSIIHVGTTNGTITNLTGLRFTHTECLQLNLAGKSDLIINW